MKYQSLYRISVIVWMSVKFFLQLERFRRKSKHSWDQERWQKLLKKQAKEYKGKAIRLEGLLVKLGQFLSTRADILPKVFLEEIEDLVDRVPSFSWEKAKQILEEEWAANYQDVIDNLSDRPIASASIGQVYRATLNSGEDVAIKIRRPNIRKIIRADFQALRIVFWLMDKFTSYGKQLDLSRLYEEVRHVIEDELDFKKELKNGLHFKDRYSDSPGYRVPNYVPEWSTKKVLVMEWMEGARITNLSYIDEKAIDRRELARKLLKGYLEQLLQEGQFHADPHSGNLLIQEDGTIVFIDFGMVGHIEAKDALSIRKLITGIVLSQYSDVTEALDELRFLLPNSDKRQIEKAIQTLVTLFIEQDLTMMDEDTAEQVLKEVQTLVNKQPIQLPSEFAFLGRAISTIVGILYTLDPEIDLIEEGKPIVQEWINREESADHRYDPKKLLKQVYARISSIENPLDRLSDEFNNHRQWEENLKKTEIRSKSMLWNKHYAFILFSLSFIGFFVSLAFEIQSLFLPTVISGCIALLTIFTVSAMEKRLWFKKEK
ncbi:AarF/UbiB family protein [Bacillus sp. N1-1]|jgi:predicted unusual protein kinase regulating ubiquinone biosynthesis (AarF/ABC1/UbiB family)|uniref:ABC1 kinase family protein n=1 Tax=Bacillus sp. N1-1 TaxID=2682541 RepID=UPI0013176D93|nr:AarF/UbiB family protein [Bacillus sp. N1-1]QHA91383.1 phosphotransferase [Bacillus sp. N1-1]